MMHWRLASYLIVALHHAFIAFAFFGALLLWVWPPVIWLHLPVISWAILIAVIGWTCPLTPLENRFRVAGGLAAYKLGFIEQYLTKRWYPNGLPRKVLALMGGAVSGGKCATLWRVVATVG
jgi:hypothetical protein